MDSETQANRSLLLHALTCLRDIGPEDNRFGICRGWEAYAPVADRPRRFRIRKGLQDLMERWPESSGDRLYPVPGFGKAPGVAYRNARNMWNRRTKYGKARRRLLDWLIEQLEKQV